ncbi:MAG: MnhB domain-containing protein [bacterium]
MSGMTVIVKTITRLIAAAIFLYGVYIVLHGHLTPGGGFAGGVIIAASFILLILSFGTVEMKEKLSYAFGSIFESIGGLLFILIASFGLILGTYFFLNFIPKGTPLRLVSGGIIPLANIALGLKVGAGLFTIFLALAASKFIMKE